MPSARLGVAVVHGLVTAIVTGEIAAGELLPPEQPLTAHFGVSRTVIRESVKRLEEKGLVRAVQGRGTVVQPHASWNILDPVVLSVLLEHDDTLGVLDELTIVRSALEGTMSAESARRRDDGDLARLDDALSRMHAVKDDPVAFAQGDADFHHLVMAISGIGLAENITHILYERARTSDRFARNQTKTAFELTLEEHQRVLDAIRSGDPVAAETAMRAHIDDAWQRRRPTNAARG
ncbi:FadR family transcriptional regulator [Agromyces intestinalis]|uniref:FadR family transcriptional regulator n=2 Tax=Agromyces intestinalis TaxID=2592652 RepID=A0A5C1YJT4_9MICO|nr:FadR family transcriptional regulator [Agromyces intestinalis]